MKDWDLPLLNQHPSSRLLSADLFAMYARKSIKNQTSLEGLRRVHELRKSMGIETPATSTVNVGMPPRYR